MLEKMHKVFRIKKIMIMYNVQTKICIIVSLDNLIVKFNREKLFMKIEAIHF